MMKNKIKTILIIIISIIALWYVRNQYSDYNFIKTISDFQLNFVRKFFWKFDYKKNKEYCEKLSQ